APALAVQQAANRPARLLVAEPRWRGVAVPVTRVGVSDAREWPCPREGTRREQAKRREEQEVPRPRHHRSSASAGLARVSSHRRGPGAAASYARPAVATGGSGRPPERRWASASRSAGAD